MRCRTIPRMLAVVGSAFLIGTVQALVHTPITLGPANLTSGTDGVKGNPRRAINDPDPVNESTDVDAAADTPVETPDDSAVETPSDDMVVVQSVPEGTLTLEESKLLWDEGAYFLDARHEHEFDAGHIQDAFFLPSTLFDTDQNRWNETTDMIPPDFTVVIYCVGGECDASKNTAALLEQMGYTDLRIMGIGYEDWVNAGYPTMTTAELEGGAP